MNTAACPSIMDFALPGVQDAWAESLPNAYNRLRGSYSVLRSTMRLQEHTERVRRDFYGSFFASMSAEEKRNFAEMLYGHVNILREGIDDLLAYKSLGLIPKLSINRYENAFVDFSDLVETIGLAADPEIATLCKRLDDVL